MTPDLFNRRFREYAVARLSEPGEHTRDEIVRGFKEAHPELFELRAEQLANKAAGQIIKEFCEESSAFVQSPLFDGFPAAINLGEGRVKALQHCTYDDIRLGEQHRQDNVYRAMDRLREYRRSMDNFRRSMAHNDETFGEMQARLAAEHQESGEAGGGAA